jgi:protein-S-isoprenylcysteine O-methyltransferase Ste14
MSPAPYEQSGAAVAFWVVFGLFALGEYAMQFRSVRDLIRHRSGRRAERGSLAAVLVGVAGGLVGGVKLASWSTGRITAGSWPLFIVGIVLMAGGLALRQWSMFVLGRYFTPDVRVHSDQTLVERGPYRWARHPSYTGLIVFFIGLGLALSNWASLILLAVVPTAGLVVRIHAEEKALVAAFGDQYHRFAATRARLVPGVW